MEADSGVTNQSLSRSSVAGLESRVIASVAHGMQQIVKASILIVTEHSPGSAFDIMRYELAKRRLCHQFHACKSSGCINEMGCLFHPLFSYAAMQEVGSS